MSLVLITSADNLELLKLCVDLELVEIPVGVRLPTAGSPQTPRKRDPHWELLLLFVVVLILDWNHVKSKTVLNNNELLTFLELLSFLSSSLE